MQGYLIVYVSARPDMQQRVVGAWLAANKLPHGLLFFTPSFSTDPLKWELQFHSNICMPNCRHKTQLVRHLIEMGICIQAAYGSAKDVSVDQKTSFHVYRNDQTSLSLLL